MNSIEVNHEYTRKIINYTDQRQQLVDEKDSLPLIDSNVDWVATVSN